MSGALVIDLDPSGRGVRVRTAEGRVPESVFLALSSAGGFAVREADGLLTDEGTLVEHLTALRRLQILQGITLAFDQSIRPLIDNYVTEHGRLREAFEESASTVSRVDLTQALAAVGWKRPLTEHQIRDVSRLAFLPHGANFSVPGAGKTTSLLALHAFQKSLMPETRLLVVAPRNALISWDDEVAECYVSPPSVVRLTGGRANIRRLLLEEASVYAITYQQLPRVLQDIKGFMRRNQVHLVLDESHRAKSGAAGVHGSAVLELAPLAVRRDILSGTPMPRAVADIVSQIEFLWPGHDVCRPILAASEEGERLRTANSVLAPLFARTTKHELGLPDLHIEYIPVELQPRQRELYDLMRSEAARLASGLDRRDRAALRALGNQVVRLVQLASNPSLIIKSLSSGGWRDERSEDVAFLLRSFLSEEEPAKLKAARGLVRRTLQSTPSAKVVIWSAFVDNIRLLEAEYMDCGVVAIHGEVPTGDDEDLAYREARIRRFNEDPECRVMVANPSACGEGISLHRACHNAIYLDRTFNAAHFLQSVDRIHRLGLPPNSVTKVYVLTASATVDETVRDRVGGRIRALSELLDDSQLMSLAYDPEDALDEVPSGLSPDDMDALLEHLLGT